MVRRRCGWSVRPWERALAVLKESGLFFLQIGSRRTPDGWPPQVGCRSLWEAAASQEGRCAEPPPGELSTGRLVPFWLLQLTLSPGQPGACQSCSHPKIPSGEHSPPVPAAPASHRICSCPGGSLRTRERKSNTDNGGGCSEFAPEFSLRFKTS